MSEAIEKLRVYGELNYVEEIPYINRFHVPGDFLADKDDSEFSINDVIFVLNESLFWISIRVAEGNATVFKYDSDSEISEGSFSVKTSIGRIDRKAIETSVLNASRWLVQNSSEYRSTLKSTTKIWEGDFCADQIFP